MLTAQPRTAGPIPTRWSYLAYLPLGAALLVWGWLVPYGFVELWLAHDAQVDEIGGIERFEVIAKRVEPFPTDRGGRLDLRPIEATRAELIDELGALGYEPLADDPLELRRDRSDRFDADLVTIAEAPDGDFELQVTVADTELTDTWWMMSIVLVGAGGVLYALAQTPRRA